MIVYQDTLSPRPDSPRTPPPLVGAQTLTRRDCTAGDLVTLGEPLGDLTVAPDGAAVLGLPDHWCCWQVGEFRPSDYLRRGPAALALLPVADAQGFAWHTPAVLAPRLEPRAGEAILPLPWGLDEHGLPARMPTPAQARLIAAARAARLEILDGRLGTVPAPIAAAMVVPLLEAAYHLVAAQLFGWQLIDDQVIVGALMGSSGFIVPREQ